MCLFLTTSFANDNPVSMLEQLKFNQSPLFVVGFVLVYLLLFFGVFCLFDFFGFLVSFWFCCDCCLLLVFCLRCYFAQFSVERFISKMQVLLENTIWLFALGAIWFTQPAQPHRTGIKHPQGSFGHSGDDSLCNHLPSPKISKVYFKRRQKCFVYSQPKATVRLIFFYKGTKFKLLKLAIVSPEPLLLVLFKAVLFSVSVPAA